MPTRPRSEAPRFTLKSPVTKNTMPVRTGTTIIKNGCHVSTTLPQLLDGILTVTDTVGRMTRRKLDLCRCSKQGRLCKINKRIVLSQTENYHVLR